MKIKNYTEIPAEAVISENAHDVKMRILISEKDNAPNFIMRIFHVDPAGYTPYHAHDWEHEVFIIEGKGTLKTKDKEFLIEEGMAILVESNEEHQFINTGSERLSFLCLIPTMK